MQMSMQMSMKMSMQMLMLIRDVHLLIKRVRVALLSIQEAAVHDIARARLYLAGPRF